MIAAPNALYIDPAATSVLVTSIGAIAIAAGATFVILWRRAKKKVSDALHIDPNAHKEVEDEIEFNDNDTNADDGRQSLH